MAMQEFVASFAADIDESSVNRLQNLLKENKTLAEGLASAFSAAKTALGELLAMASNEDSPLLGLFGQAGEQANNALSEAVTNFDGEVVLPTSLDLTKANQQLKQFKRSDNTTVRLTGDASGVVSAASTALASIKAMYSGTTLSVTANVNTNNAGGNAGTAGGNQTSGGAQGSGLFRSSIGGRFTRRSVTELAEDGQTEYVIPIQKESIAVPLIRQMLGELSGSAKESLAPALQSMPSLGALTANSAAGSGGGNSVQAPVNITVNASQAAPEAVGKSVYNIMERYLIRTLKGAMI